MRKANELSLQTRVKFCGFVQDDILPALLTGATLFVLPSLCEGFGLPVLEAMACGTPVLTSDRSSLPEVAGEAALLVDPEKPEAIADGIRRMLEDNRYRTELGRRGRERAGAFRWADTARNTVAVYREALDWHVVRQFHPSVGGIQSAVLALCDRLQRRGHQCEVVTLRRIWNDPRPLPPADVMDGLRVDRIPFVGGRRYFLAPGILRFAAGHTIIHIHAIDFFADFLAATKWCHRTPFVVSTHGGIFHTSWAMRAKRIYFQTITRLALTQAARVICDSAQDDRLFAPIVAARKRVTIANGVEDAFFDIRKSVDAGLLVMVGRIAEHKGIDRVIDLLPQISRQVSGARLVVVGPDWEGLQASLRARAQARGVAERVVFAGAVDRATLREYLGRAHLVLAASSFEGFGIAVIEAMASGSLVIGNDIEAHRELIQQDQDGILVDFGDKARAVQTVVGTLRLPVERVVEMGERARRVASRFSWDRVVDQVERVYRESVAGAVGR